MKLVNAKCPNCGANIEVNSDIKTVKCDYCRSDILVEDAVEKYKLEISGEVEVSDIKRINNLLTLAERNYNNNLYENAYENYKAVLELEPNNSTALLRHGICKTKINNYIDFGLEYLVQSFKDTIQIIENKNNDKDSISIFAKEVLQTIDESLYATRKYYNTYTLTETDIEEIQKKLISIFNAYEFLLQYYNDKEYLYTQIISVLKDILREKKYKSGHGEFGGNIIKIYSIKNDKQQYIDKLNYYKNLTHTEQDDDDFKFTAKDSNEKNKLIAFCLCLFLGFLGAHKFYEGKYVWGILYFFTFGLFFIGWFVDILIILTKPNPYYV